MIRRNEWPLIGVGFMATLCGVGLSRFAYTALMPAMVQAGWFSPSQTAYLGAANLLGYLVGALSAHALTERLGARRVLGAAFAAVALSFALSSVPQSFTGFFAWRFAAGVAGAILMVIGPSVGMSAAPVGRRAVLGPLMFSGIGWGALLAATVVPTLAARGLPAVWWALAALAALAGGLGVRAGARLAASAAAPVAAAGASGGLRWSAAVLLVMLAYACDAAG
ncbi:MAG TPA: YbfB/YjiJ family MFS transporter, partial [Aquabacterium sp.]|nr:YbfB/YjiJ family MFS transporter [Aquabacterium sp.]